MSTAQSPLYTLKNSLSPAPKTKSAQGSGIDSRLEAEKTSVSSINLPPAELPTQRPHVAYFCAEYGLQPGLPFYAGGLGILAGDVVKEAADQAYPMVGVGLFYHGKRDQQVVEPDGWQNYVDYTFEPHEHGFTEVQFPDGSPWRYDLPLGQETVAVFALARKLSDTVTVYFLETDRPENPWHLRDLVLAPYWGDQRAQLQQQLILGCAGIRLLQDLDLLPEIIHLNEGRPALLGWELASQVRASQNITGKQALEQVKQRTVYTNHTLVRAGNLAYPRELVQEYATAYANKLDVPVEYLLDLGVDSDPTLFEITHYAMNMSRIASGVSQRHTNLCKDQWPEFSWKNITNGVHFPTWQRHVFRDAAGSQPTSPNTPQSPNTLTDHAFWTEHMQAKHDLMFEALARTGFGYDPNHLVLGWARRITEYKRLDSLFADIEKFQQVFGHSEQPIQLLVAGKAHPGDEHAKSMLREVIQIFQHELSGMALFIPNYDVALAQKLVAGVDLWVNTPVDGREASGTSGMKAAANGVLQATVADGWAAEVDWTDIGWTLNPDKPGLHLLDLLEQEIRPLYYQRSHLGVPHNWVERMRKTQQVANRYSATRMFDQYQDLLYNRSSSPSKSKSKLQLK